MEVWGGNRQVDSGIVLPGLDARIYSLPFGGSADGGDVHYVSSCASGTYVRLLVADVSGHGQPVAQTADRLRQLMRRHINDHDQVRFVRSMNREFASLSPDGGFATAVVLTFVATTNQLMVCNAGHPPPLWYRAARREWTLLETPPHEVEGVTNVPLGIEDAADYERFDVDMEVGDVVICYTDSLIESRDGQRELLGTGGLLRIARALPEPDAVTIVPTLLAAIGREAEGNLSDDDVTCLMFRPNGLRRRIPLHDRLLAPFRFLAGLPGTLRPTGA